MYSTNMPQKLNLKASKNISFTKNSCQDQQDLLVSAGHHCLFTLYSTSHIYIPSKQNRPKQHTSRPKPASAKEPLASRSFARLETELRVSGCTGPSWSSRPIRALRWSSSACRVGCGWMTAGWLPMPWRDGPSAVIRNR